MKRLLNAAAKTILLFGSLHILVLLLVFLKTGNFSIFNIARILEIDLIIPLNTDGIMERIISFLFLMLVYGIVYSRFTK